MNKVTIMLNKLNKQLKDFYPYLILALFIRIVFWYFFPSLIITHPDTFSYINAGKVMAEKKTLVNPDRGPIYPLVLSVIFSLFDSHNIKSDVMTTAEGDFYIKSNKFVYLLIISLQTFIGLLTILLIFLISKKIFKNKTLVALLVIFNIFNIYLISMDRMLIPESMTVFWLLMIAFSGAKLISRYSQKRLVVYIFFTYSAFLLRPIYLLLPFFLNMIILKRNIGKLNIAYFSLILLYILINYHVYNYPSISNIADLNLVGKTIQYRLSSDEIHGYQPVKGAYEEYISSDKKKSPWAFLKHYPEIFTDQGRDNDNLFKLYEFSKKLILNRPLEFIVKSIILIPEVIDETPYLSLYVVNYGNGAILTNPLLHIYTVARHFNIFALLFYPLSFANYIYFQTKQSMLIFFIGTISIYQIIFSVFFSYSQYGRLIGAAQPLIYIFILSFITYSFKSAKDKVLHYLI